MGFLNDSEFKKLPTKDKIAYKRFLLEERNVWFTMVKWGLLAVGSCIVYCTIDKVNVKTEKFKVDSAYETKLMDSYLAATETVNPDLWLRKLAIIKNFAKDASTKAWVEKEEKYISQKLALLSLYKELIGVCSVIANRREFGSEKWNEAYAKFYQLHFAQLPFYDESLDVADEMSRFKKQMDVINNDSSKKNWDEIDKCLLSLSGLLKEQTNKIINDNSE